MDLPKESEDAALDVERGRFPVAVGIRDGLSDGLIETMGELAREEAGVGIPLTAIGVLCPPFSFPWGSKG